MKKIAIFNHKGGVSKTTTTFNLGHALSKLGKRVLLVDTDSQCNLSLYAMGYEKYEQYCESKNPNNIYDCLMPAYKSMPKLIESAECYELSDNIFLLPGNLDFSQNEVQLGIAMQLSDTLGAMGNLPGALYYLMEKTGKQYSADYVLFDMNPSLSAINKDVLISSDYFIVPTSPDFFSVMAIKSLSQVLPSWERWAGTARELLREATYPLPLKTPKFLGYTINDFNLSNGKPQKTFESFMGKISAEVIGSLVPELDKAGMMMSSDTYKAPSEHMQKKMRLNKCNVYKDEYCIAQISNFNKLGALSNEMSIPVFDLVLKSPTEGQKKTLQWFIQLYSAMAERIVELTNE